MLSIFSGPLGNSHSCCEDHQCGNLWVYSIEMVIFSCILVFKQEKVHNTTPIYPHFIFHKGGSIFNHAERTEMHDETTLQKLGLNKLVPKRRFLVCKRRFLSTQKEFFSMQKEISRPRHLTRARLLHIRCSKVEKCRCNGKSENDHGAVSDWLDGKSELHKVVSNYN